MKITEDCLEYIFKTITAVDISNCEVITSPVIGSSGSILHSIAKRNGIVVDALFWNGSKFLVPVVINPGEARPKFNGLMLLTPIESAMNAINKYQQNSI